jgi:hypothetical protein
LRANGGDTSAVKRGHWTDEFLGENAWFSAIVMFAVLVACIVLAVVR